MDWNVAQAKQRLSEVLRSAAEEPQRIYNRRSLVAAVVNAERFEEFERWERQSARTSIGDDFARLRSICAKEGNWELAVPDRSDRPNPFAEALHVAAVRHQHPE